MLQLLEIKLDNQMNGSLGHIFKYMCLSSIVFTCTIHLYIPNNNESKFTSFGESSKCDENIKIYYNADKTLLSLSFQTRIKLAV